MMHGMLFNALVYLAAAVIAVPLARRFGLGAVLGYLVAGIVIGPWGLRLISGVEEILHFSEFGVVLLLFLIGLELDPKKLWALRRSIFGWGSAQVGATTALLFGAALAFGVDWKPALIASLGLSLSSTAIALATLEERHLLPTAAGSAGFSILLFQDIAAIPMIAIVPLLGGAGGGGNAGWLGALQAAAVIIALVVVGRTLTRPIMRAIAKTGIREVFTAFALLLVVGIGLLMQSVGMSMALGTFLAGVLLADSEYRHALETDLEPFKGLLLGLFFIAIGMSIDFGVLLKNPLLIAALLCTFLVIKTALLFLLARYFAILPAQRPLFAVLLSQGGEFGFVIFGAAAAGGVLSTEMSSVLMVVVAMSMVATPLLLVLHDKLVMPRFRASGKRSADAIDGRQEPVIIAGFGRFGQIVGRLLHANGVGVTVLDHDPDQIDLLRRFGYKVYYGDATRIDLLRAAGAGEARALIVAVDGIEESLALVDAVKAEFPALPVLARARNVTHYYDLMDRGVTVIERETFEAALQLGRRALQQLGFDAYEARQAAMKFRAHNLKTLHTVYPHYKDQQQMISMAAQAREELAAMFARDAEIVARDRDGDWHQ
ncbi:MAG TPA: glutathione-regulated potassium-efflux system protein KefC [Noviherbaspirillum sp.]|nr:glutathione-regulated potassium-efflux system protein KefC [Noviherbaspirillum sp.]HYD95710.1 glutathione-regulated potassium-efflux system protein KefC [Noviherbaspirillum sp.]